MHTVAYKRNVVLSRQDCANLVYNKKLYYHGKYRDVKLPRDYIFVDPLYGRDSMADSSCGGVDFFDERSGRQFKKAVVKAFLDITITEEEGLFIADNNQVIIDRVSCPMTDLFCEDSDRGTYIWDPVIDSCKSRHMELIYRPGVKYIPDDPEERPVLIVEDPAKRQTLGLVLMGYDDSCGMRTHTTQIDNIRVVFGSIPMKAMNFTPSHYDKFMSMEASMHKNMISTGLTIQETFKHLVEESCESRRSSLKNALAALQSSNLMTVEVEGFNFVGTKIIRTGRSAQILKCEKSEAVYRETKECWQDIPVTHHNESVFVDSLNSIVKQNSSRAFCSGLYPIQYLIQSEWWCSSPDIRPCSQKEEPVRLSPKLSKVQDYEVQLKFESLGNKGYSSEQREKHRAWQVYQDVVQATLTEIGAGKQKDEGSGSSIDFTDLFPTESFDGLSKLVSQNLLGILTLWLGEPYRQLQEAEGLISLSAWVVGALAGLYASYAEKGWHCCIIITLIMPAISQIFFPIWLALYAKRLHEMVMMGPCSHQLAAERERREREQREREGISVWDRLWAFVKRIFCGRPKPNDNTYNQGHGPDGMVPPVPQSQASNAKPPLSSLDSEFDHYDEVPPPPPGHPTAPPIPLANLPPFMHGGTGNVVPGSQVPMPRGPAMAASGMGARLYTNLQDPHQSFL